MKMHCILMASASALALTLGAVSAHAADAPSTADTTTASTVGTVTVTARRQKENLQNVPESATVVSGDAIQKLSIDQADEVSKLAPGLTLAGSGLGQQIVLRGVAWEPGSGTPATPIYFNEVPFDPGETVREVFDIGQIEVLRGPQGTTRGAPSISGAVTMTTRRPDLADFGGYVQGSYGEGSHSNVQGAVNIPIIKDVLGVRAAFYDDDNEGNRIDSVNSSVKPASDDRVYRLSALFKPVDSLSIEAMFQHRDEKDVSFSQVVGAGSPGSAGGLIVSQLYPAIAPNFNGPALSEGDRKSVQTAPSYLYDNTNLFTVNANWKVLGQQLSYIYGFQQQQDETFLIAQQSLNMTPGFEGYNLEKDDGPEFWQSQEIRLASQPGTYQLFDYDIGYFQKRSGGLLNFVSPTYLSGAFGRPDSAIPGAVTTPNGAYVLNSSTNIGIGQTFQSYYGNLQLHLWGTEVSGGLAQVRDNVPVSLAVSTAPALNAVVSPFIPPGFCAFAGTAFTPATASTNYPGSPQVCDVHLPAGIGNSNLTYNNTYSHTLYNLSISHKFFGNVLAYATTGTSYRSGLPAINNTGLPGGLTNPKPETATSYELGVKTSWGPRLTVDADVFQIDYQNQLTTFQGVNYYNSSTTQISTTSIAFYDNINSIVRGFEVQIAAAPIDHLSLGANFSYAPITSQGGNVPCNVGPALTAANPINLCASPKGQALSQTAPFQANVSGDYTVPIGSLDGYARFNISYQGNNPNFGNDPIAGHFKSTPAYTIVDVFVGVTKLEGRRGWDLGLYAKNLFDTQVELSRFTPLNNFYAPFANAPGGYDVVSMTLPREAGVKLNYTF